MNPANKMLNQMLYQRLSELGFESADVEIEYTIASGEVDAISFTGVVTPEAVLEVHFALNRELTGKERVKALRSQPVEREIFDLVDQYSDAMVQVQAEGDWPHQDMVHTEFQEFSGQRMTQVIEDEPDILSDDLAPLSSWDAEDWYDWHIDWAEFIKKRHDQVCTILEEEANAFLYPEQPSREG